MLGSKSSSAAVAAQTSIIPYQPVTGDQYWDRIGPIGGSNWVFDSMVQSGIIDPDQIRESRTFIWLMMAAMLAGAVWLNLATALGAPVSTTHSIVGGVLGAGIAAGGPAIAEILNVTDRATERRTSWTRSAASASSCSPATSAGGRGGGSLPCSACGCSTTAPMP